MIDLKLVKFGGTSVPSDKFHREMKNLIEECDNLYPGIESWFKRKVLPGFSQKDRIGYLVCIDSIPVGATIIKRGTNAKICSLRIIPDNQGNNLGELLFALAAIELRGEAKRVHFTAPSQLWSEKSDFFSKFGFKLSGLAGTQYRLFDDEISCDTTFDIYWKSVLRLLPSIGDSLSNQSGVKRCELVLSIKPDPARKILNGSKRIEIRRRFSQRWKGSRAVLYSSSPERALVGEIKIGEIIKDTPENIWNEYEKDVGCDKKTFQEYCKGASKVYAIKIDEVKSFGSPLFGSQLEHLIESDIRPPQSYCEIKVNSVWPATVTLSHLITSRI
ncbi:MAG: ASCH domain-containing protein [candidate division Zixibacteria bacterium]|nr:ASCH domain-containing protein [candidate division Zixibacteria bacterium]